MIYPWQFLGKAVVPALLISVGLLPFATAQEPDELPLPRWSAKELETMQGVPDAQAVPESMLWPPGMLDITPPVTMPWYLGEGDSPDADQPHADVSLFLPPSLVGAPGASAAPKAIPFALPKRVVSAEFMARLVVSPADVHLIDPGQALLPAFREDLTRFVESHARDSQIQLYVLVLGPEEMLPTGANLSGIAQGALEKGHGSLLVYPMGDPAHARLFMSRSICAVSNPAELNETLQDARQDALQGATQEEQLHRLLVRLSIRLFWLERLLDKPHETIARAIPTTLTQSALPEVGAGIEQTGWNWRSLPWEWVGGVLCLLLAAWAAWRWRGYRLRHYEWVLPEPKEIVPRLGAPHCASAVWVSYR